MGFSGFEMEKRQWEESRRGTQRKRLNGGEEGIKHLDFFYIAFDYQFLRVLF